MTAPELERVDPKALDLLDQAMQQPHGGDHSKSDVITLAEDPNQRGTSRDYSLRKLRKDAPELHEQVIAGALAALAAHITR